MTGAPLLTHLLALSDGVGLFEHAEYTRPRPEHGYCVDDVARGLIVIRRAEVPTPEAEAAAEVYLDFVLASIRAQGHVVNRRDVHGAWNGEPGVQDCWGRAIWALGTAAARDPEPRRAALAREGFAACARARSPWPRSMALAGLGAAEVLDAHPGDPVAMALLADAARSVGRPAADSGWPWPEPRLTYANALFPDVLLAAGHHLRRPDLVADGLVLLTWLVGVETAADHLSFTPWSGWGPGEPRPAFDQQPIEAAALADACARAWDLTGDSRWALTVQRCLAWFGGANDSGTVLADPVSGGCCDGLEAAGRNDNQGAESTVALISTRQHALRVPAPSLA